MADLAVRAEMIRKMAAKEIARHTKQAETPMSGDPPLMGLKRYPEFSLLVDKIVHAVVIEINAEARKIKSEMPYKAQFVLEEVIRELQERV
jgi:hypothetical protein